MLKYNEACLVFEIIVGTVSSLWARILANILVSVFKREIGQIRGTFHWIFPCFAVSVIQAS